MKMIWFDQSANARRLGTPDGVARMVERCAEAGITDILLNVRNPGGLALYPSEYVAHRSEVFDDYPRGYDLLALTLERAHRLGLRVHAAPDIFAGGYWNNDHPAFIANQRPDWQSVIYGLDGGRPVCLPFRRAPRHLQTAVPIDWQGVGFLNPGHPEVREYLLAMLEEIARQYPVDGFCLDRGRYNSLNADFSETTRLALGVPAEDWPEAVYRIAPEAVPAAQTPDAHGGISGASGQASGEGIPGTRCIPGPLFGPWLEYRAGVIRQFFEAARRRVKAARPSALFGTYTGSWYPLYYQVGVNWASRRYDPGLLWVGPAYARAGYADQLDYLCTGCYYPEVTVAEARAKNAPADWYSVEGAADLSVAAVMGETPLVASLYLLQYRGNLAQYHAAVRMCRERSAGVMLFDLCYVDDYDWWTATREALA